MPESDNAFPMDFYVDDPSPRPWKFRPEGYLVVILRDAGEGQRAETALATAGFAPRDVKVYTGEQILENYAVYVEHRTITDRVVGPVVDDAEGKELYLGYAGEGRSAMWLRLPDEADVQRALRVLADHDYLQARYYGAHEQTDFNVS